MRKIQQRSLFLFLLLCSLPLINQCGGAGAGSTAGGGGGGTTETGPYSTLFDGVNEQAITTDLIDDILDNARLELFTISYWMKLVATPASNAGIVGTTTDGQWNDGFGFFWNVASSRLVFFVNHWSTNQVFYTGIATGTWYHIVGTFNEAAGSNNVRLYVDGVQRATTGYPPQVQRIPNKGLQFGALGTTYTNVKIDQVSIWNTELSGPEITEVFNGSSEFDPTTDTGNYSSSSSLRGFWKMGDDDTQPTLTDTAGGFDSTLINVESSDFVTDVP